MNKRPKKIYTFKERIKRQHRYYLHTGMYAYFFKNLAKLVLILGAIVSLILGLNTLFDIQSFLDKFVHSLRPKFVFVLFFVSESILGWIPPDIFIIWAKECSHPFTIVTLLASLSYLGGIVAYYIGAFVRQFPKVNAHIEKRYASDFKKIKKWGGFVIIMAALFPLPFATISTIAGMVNYPFRNYLIFGLTRYIRFFVYAIPIFRALNSIMG